MTAESIGNRRSACDRCRRHKLRCERGHAAQCRRCEKINAECYMGPALKSGRPQQLSDVQSSESDFQFYNGHLEASPAFPHLGHPDANMPALTTPPSLNASGSDPALQQLISPTELDDFNNFWSDNVGNDVSLTATSDTAHGTPLSENQEECLKKLSDLQARVVVDLETVKCCITIDKCPDAVNTSFSNPVTSQNAMVGRMFEYSTSLIDLLNKFQPYDSPAPFELTCDTPTMFVLLSCYVSLVRIYRTILSCLLDSLPLLSGLKSPVPQLFPGMNLGGFKLEARLDLQLRILVQISEDMLMKIESRFGLVGHIFEPTGNMHSQGKAARILSSMLEEESNEQPPLYVPRGHCESLKTILIRLRSSL